MYVYATPGHAEYADQLLTARREAVEMVSRDLRRKKSLTIVDRPEQADVRLELLESTTKHMGRENTTPSTWIGTNTRALKDYAIRGKLSVDDYTLEIEGTHRV